MFVCCLYFFIYVSLAYSLPYQRKVKLFGFFVFFSRKTKHKKMLRSVCFLMFLVFLTLYPCFSVFFLGDFLGYGFLALLNTLNLE